MAGNTPGKGKLNKVNEELTKSLKQHVTDMLDLFNENCRGVGNPTSFTIDVMEGKKKFGNEVRLDVNTTVQGKVPFAALTVTAKRPEGKYIIYRTEYVFTSVEEMANREYWEHSLYKSLLYECLGTGCVVLLQALKNGVQDTGKTEVDIVKEIMK